MRGVIAEGAEPNAALTRELLASPSMDGLDLATAAGAKVQEIVGKGPRVVAYDFGMKRNIVRMLADHGLEVVIVPPTTTAAQVRALEPRGLFLSNGPGDPAAISYAAKNIRELAQSGIPTFGICLGHQLLGLAFGGRTTKLLYGHRGGNHPVKDLRSGEVLITSQNHGFAVEGAKEGVGIPGAPDLEITHRNLNDGSVEGLRHKKLPVFAVQYHPEAAPGPHDAFPHFGEFLRSMGVEAPPRGVPTP
jgi:carbamoyl-phosphate synthase small subunit